MFNDFFFDLYAVSCDIRLVTDILRSSTPIVVVKINDLFIVMHMNS